MHAQVMLTLVHLSSRETVESVLAKLSEGGTVDIYVQPRTSRHFNRVRRFAY